MCENSNYMRSLSAHMPIRKPPSAVGCIRVLSDPGRIGPGTREIPRETPRKDTYTILHFVRLLSSCPSGYIFLVTRLIPRKHATSSSFFEVRDWFSWRYKSPKCLEIRIYERTHANKYVCVDYIPSSLAIDEQFYFYFHAFNCTIL